MKFAFVVYCLRLNNLSNQKLVAEGKSIKIFIIFVYLAVILWVTYPFNSQCIAFLNAFEAVTGKSCWKLFRRKH